MVWQPISTAPTDRRVLVFVPEIGPVMGKFTECWIKFPKRPVPLGYWRLEWWHSMPIQWQMDRQPTHWMDVTEPRVPGRSEGDER